MSLPHVEAGSVALYVDPLISVRFAGVYEPELARRNKQAAEMMHGWRRGGSGATSADYSGME